LLLGEAGYPLRRSILATHGGVLTLRDTTCEPDDTKLMRISFILPQTMTPIPFGGDDEPKYVKN